MSQQTTNYLKLIYQQQTRKKLSIPFIKTTTDTIPFILKIDNYFKVNREIPEHEQFQIIFDIMPEVAQIGFMTHCDEMTGAWVWSVEQEEQNSDNPTAESFCTVKELKAWFVKTWPPPQSRRDILSACSNASYRRNEDPNAVYHRIVAKMAQANKCISLINEGIMNAVDKLALLRNDEKYEIFLAVFYKNNTLDFAINKRAKQLVIKNNPKTLDALIRNIKFLHNRIMPSCVKGLDTAQYEYHEASKNDMNPFGSAKILGQKRKIFDNVIDDNPRKHKQSKIPCRYHPNCKKSNCTFYHAER